MKEENINIIINNLLNTKKKTINDAIIYLKSTDNLLKIYKLIENKREKKEEDLLIYITKQLKNQKPNLIDFKIDLIKKKNINFLKKYIKDNYSTIILINIPLKYSVKYLNSYKNINNEINKNINNKLINNIEKIYHNGIVNSQNATGSHPIGSCPIGHNNIGVNCLKNTIKKKNNKNICKLKSKKLNNNILEKYVNYSLYHNSTNNHNINHCYPNSHNNTNHGDPNSHNANHHPIINNK